MAPVLEVLDGDGSLSTSQVQIEGFPVLERLSETLQVQRLANPTVNAIRSNIHIEDGRLLVDPFDVTIAGMAMSVSGSNGIDESVDYTLALRVPRNGLAEATLTGLAERMGPLGASLAAVDPVTVSTRVTGTVTEPALGVGLAQPGTSVQDAASQQAEAAVQERVEAAQAEVDAARAEARQRAQAEGDSLVAAAEARAETIRAEGRRAAAEVRAEGERAANEVLARATNPVTVTRAAAEPAAARIRSEAEERALTIEREADERANALTSEARARADALLEAADAR